MSTSQLLKKRIKSSPTLIFVFVFAFSGSVNYLPAHHNWFFWQRWLATLGQLMVGVIEIPLHSALRSLSTSHWPIYFIAAAVPLSIVGLCIALLTRMLWQLGCWGKFILVGMVLANLFVGYLLAIWTDIPVEPGIECEKLTSRENGVRIIAYPEIGILPGTVFFYLSTQDGGKTWKQFIVSRQDDYAEPQCENVQSIGKEFIWTWTIWDVAVTHNGGETWQIWHWPCDEQKCSYGAVENVKFEDRQHGRMKVNPWKGNVSTLITEDGGQTWNTVE